MDGYIIIKDGEPLIHLGVFVDREVAETVINIISKNMEVGGEYGLGPVYVHYEALTK